MSPFLVIPRAPQATTTPSSTTSTSNGSRTSSAASSSTPTWDTRVGSVVFSTYQPAQTTSAAVDDSQSSGGLLSSKPGVAGLCAGIAVICILIAGFFIYRVKFRQPPTQVNVATPKSVPSTSRFSKKPPSPFQLGSRARHPLGDNMSRSTSSSRSFYPSNAPSSRAPRTERSYRGGDVMEITPTRYQHSNSSIARSVTTSTYAHTRQTSDAAAVSGGLISEYTPQSLPSRSFERLSAATDSRLSMLDSSSYTSRTHLLPQPQLISNTHESHPVIPTRRPLPVPPHPPPSYEQVSSARPLQIMSTIPDTEGKNQAHLDFEPEALTPSTLVGAQSPHVKAQVRGRTSSLNESRRSTAPTLAGPTPLASPSAGTSATGREEPAFLRRSRDDAVLDMELAMTRRSHRRHPSSGEHDPFTTMNYELPGWLDSDPYPAQTLRPSISQPSLFGGAARSTAASSHVLPSDSSIRTLTPELTLLPLPPLPADPIVPEDPNHSPHSPGRYSVAPAYTPAATTMRSRPLSAIEGDGPSVDEVLVYHGAERPGWAQTSPLSPAFSVSRNRRHFPTDQFQADDLHPIAEARLGAQHPAIVGDTNTITTSAGVVGTDKRISDQELTFMSLTPPPAAIQGLNRAYSLDSPSPHRRLFELRARGFGRMSATRSPTVTLDRPFSHLSSVQGGGLATGTTSIFEEGERGRGSLAPSSNVLPSEVVSIRSISPETGWIGSPESAEGHDYDGGGAQERGLPTIDEDGHERQHDPTPSPRPSPVRDEASEAVGWGRASKLSMGEVGVLWGQYTSAMEQGHPSPS